MNAYELSLKLIQLSNELETVMDNKEKAKNKIDIKNCERKIDNIEKEFLKVKKLLEETSVRDI